jgi:RHH-type transcriptional regulator, proline utilization regulon repressor / proline dehydrogenase / delta 1-pyrroline-5-carboxylate dehydrogenase
MTDDLRREIRRTTLLPEEHCIAPLVSALSLDAIERATITQDAAGLVRDIRARGESGLMEKFLAQYGLNTDEGVALMCLAEAYLRTPDAETLDALISDKIGEGDWSRHLGRAESALVNASTWALMLTGRVFRSIPARTDDLTGIMRGTVRRLGEPVARVAVGEAMKLLGRQFVLGRTIDEALENSTADRARGYLHSYDMLGEAARTGRDASRYFASYAAAIGAIGRYGNAGPVHEQPGISVKLSALHPRYETVNRSRVLEELLPRIAELARLASSNNLPLAIDAEEADRLDLSLDIIAAMLADPMLSGWDGLGIVVQAYQRRAPAVIDWLYAETARNSRRISVRLVKGAYWDSEIKQSQVLGLAGFPVYTRKETTDLCYLACARKLLYMTDRIFPQFATHNAHTVTAVNHIAQPESRFEFQRLHGMGESLHEVSRQKDGRRRRIYAPVGVHKDLLAYLVRRLLENGANSSFVHQILDRSVTPERIAADPVERVLGNESAAHPAIRQPGALYGKERKNSKGRNLNDPADLATLDTAMAHFAAAQWGSMTGREIRNPADRRQIVGHVVEAGEAEASEAIDRSLAAFPQWSATSPAQRAAVLEASADLYEANSAELMAICVREAGKTRFDAVAEIREAVDFLRYYASRLRGSDAAKSAPKGVVVCISPWNFPLAIFTGQIAGALAAGNCVVAKPAEQAPLIAQRALELFREAGLQDDALIVVHGDGGRIGPVLTGDRRIAAVVFTGSGETARLIDLSMAEQGNPQATLIAETGGVNAMIVDSTALPEQAVRDILASAFQSAGQRCSALRVLFLQGDIAPMLFEMLEGAARELRIGDPWNPATDVGPVIDAEARKIINNHCETLAGAGRLMFRLELPREAQNGTFVAPAAFRLDSLRELEKEVFGPVLHIVKYEADQLDDVVDAINRAGYGLTLGIHSRIDRRVDRICARARVGNIYVNRNQIGAIVGVQPFGGENLSGTGPKAGGPHYVPRLASSADQALPDVAPVDLGGPTGERNTYLLFPRGRVACLGPGKQMQARQAELAARAGNTVLNATPGEQAFDKALAEDQIAAVMIDGPIDRQWRMALARKPGRRIPIIRAGDDPAMLYTERCISEDTTASGGNATLLSVVS